MATVIIALILIAVVTAAPFLVRFLKRQARDQRDKRLRIAEGIFDEPAPPTRWQRFWLKWRPQLHFAKMKASFDKEYKPPMPKQLIVDLAHQLQMQVEEVLRTGGALAQAQAERTKAESDYLQASKLADACQGALLDGGDMTKLAELVSACQSPRRLMWEFEAAHKHLVEAAGASDSARTTLQGTLKKLQAYDWDDIPASLRRVIDLCLQISVECSRLSYVDSLQRPEAIDEPAQPHAEAEAAALRALELAEKLLPIRARLIAVHAQTDHEHGVFKQISQGPTWVPPVRPTEQDVQAFIGAGQIWTDDVQEQRKVFSKLLPSLIDEIDQLHRGKVALEDELSKLRILQEHARAAEVAAAAAAAQAAELAREQALKASLAARLDKPADDSSGSDEQELDASGKLTAQSSAAVELDKERSIVRLQQKPQRKVAFLTSKAEASRDVATRILKNCSSLLGSSIWTDYKKWSSRRWVQDDTEVSAQSKQALGELKAAMRKFGFARAQFGAAAEKLAVAQATPAALAEVIKPSISDGSVDNYLRVFRRWVKAEQSNAAAVTERKGKIRQLELQLAERKSQLQAAGVVLGEVRGRAKSSAAPWGDQLRAAMNVARLLDAFVEKDEKAEVVKEEPKRSKSNWREW